MELRITHRKPKRGKEAESVTLRSSGPISRFNRIGSRSLYIRQYSDVKYEDSKQRKWDVRPELLLHRGKTGRIERASVVFGGKTYHYEIVPADIRGDGYIVFKALEEAARGNLEPLKELSERWRGETKIVLADKRGKGRIELKIHAEDIKDMLERYTRLKLGIERQTALDEFLKNKNARQ